MILNCNSCGKKFVVPDKAITASGRLVQCGSCGNKWKQYPINEIKQVKLPTKIEKLSSNQRKASQKIQKPKSVKKSTSRKPREIDLYSPEYLAKKHGIRIDSQPVSKNKKASGKTKVSFGFYSLVIVSVLITITILRLLYFAEDIIVERFPISEIYIDYLFESIRNIKEIIQNFFAGY